MYFTGVTGLVAGHPFDTVKVSEHHINKSVNFFSCSFQQWSHKFLES